mmetsp:Transcript_177513/g.563159  ORF Transcript_177513/g.563159 Transcript_177513/m.563159 type:complete len:292 (-) Transcript_177513:103-978(-)
MSRIVALWPGREHPCMRITTPSQPCLPMHRRAAMMVFRGGAYAIHDGSGRGCAEFLADRGMLAVEVEYRTVTGPGPCAEGMGVYPKPIHDAARAVRVLRSMATELGIDPNRIGVTGFSAGGHLASMLCGTELPCQEADDDDLVGVSCRPDVCVLAYPVISMCKELRVETAHPEDRCDGNLGGSVGHLLGPHSEDEATLALLSAELRVVQGHPPTFIWHTRADDCVPVRHTEVFVEALEMHGVPHKCVLFDSGPHALGLALDGEHANDWSEQLMAWLGAWAKPQFAAPAMQL